MAEVWSFGFYTERVYLLTNHKVYNLLFDDSQKYV